jgi:Rieske Fe-S protein
MLVGAGAVGVAALLAGCQTYGNETPAPPAASTEPSPTAGSPGASTSAAPPPAAAVAKVSEIPVGGGKIIEDEGIVITQPTAGTIKAYSAICTHQGCVVSGVSNGKIVCSCHGSEFKIADGTVAKGPATQKLAAAKVTVNGDNITRG